MTLKPLGKVKNLVETIGMGVSHAYEDLVFLEHNAFLLQFGQDERTLIVHTNEEAAQDEIAESLAQLKKLAPLHDLAINRGTSYTLASGEKDTIVIKFQE